MNFNQKTAKQRGITFPLKTPLLSETADTITLFAGASEKCALYFCAMIESGFARAASAAETKAAGLGHHRLAIIKGGKAERDAALKLFEKVSEK